MIILGVCGGPRGTHEPGIVLLKDSKIIFASQEERFNRNKNSISCFPQQILKKALKYISSLNFVKKISQITLYGK